MGLARAKALRLLAIGTFLWGGWAFATSEREVALVQVSFDNGRYQDARQRAEAALADSTTTPSQRVVLQRLAGLSAFHLGDSEGAEAHFLKLLTLDPDAQLDPFAVPPKASALFDRVRTSNAEAIAMARQIIQLRSDQARRATQEEVRREALREATSKAASAATSRDQFWVKLLPFGVPQFRNGRTGWGIAFAAAQAVFGAVSIGAFWSINSLYETKSIVLTDRLSGNPTNTFTAQVYGIPAGSQRAYTVWTVVKYAAGGAFYASWGASVAEAMLRDQPRGDTPSNALAPEEHRVGIPVVSVLPLPGGVGAAVTLRF